MEAFLILFAGVVVFLGPVFYFLAYARELFNAPILLLLTYILCLVFGFTLWEPMVMITLVFTWLLTVASWVYVVWGMLRAK